ncbi:MAG: hypothetical protein NMNS01_27630 [Nitrosomonas sp.]|nr:MAG: hypothetical protein NMNS01_27630 [Nitrosomonas sp.]
MIQLFYGNQQQFRLRHGDINILGRTDSPQSVKRAQYRLNGDMPIPFYIEPATPSGEGKYAWDCNTPSIFRLRDCPGAFNIEIAVDSPNLQEGLNRITIEIEDSDGEIDTLTAEFHWNPCKIELPININDLNKYESIQEVGQVVNGLFEIDRQRNSIVSCEPVGADILFLIGSPGESQEATYDVEFNLHGNCGNEYAGLSDFFFRHEEQSPELGIKPGYCTSGLSTISPAGEAKLWMAIGDCLTGKDWAWVIHTENSSYFQIQSDTTYRVRHQVIIHDSVNWSRYKIWKKDDEEPNRWLCDMDNAHLKHDLPKIDKASFGLFQFGGNPTSWSNISVRRLELTSELLAELVCKKTFRSIQQKRIQLCIERIMRRAKNLYQKIFRLILPRRATLHHQKNEGNNKDFINKNT